jgi:hypothetical protein
MDSKANFIFLNSYDLTSQVDQCTVYINTYWTLGIF